MDFQQRYKYNSKTDLLGKGGFARVYKAKDSLLDRDVAIKIFNATESGQYTVIEEIKKAIRLQHPNLLRYYDVAVVETTNALDENNSIQIGVMELANAGDLKQFARSNPGSPLLFSLLQQVLSGLAYLHQKGIIHRDLKPQNILLVEEDGELTAKISDFGISKSMDTGTSGTSMAIGTIEYMAPEQFNPGKYGVNGKIGTNADLWSFGIMVHELITNETLFGQRNGNTTAEQIMNAILNQALPPDIENLPEPYKSVVKKCLVADARQRIQKAKDLIALLEQPAKEAAALAITMPLQNALLQKINQQTENIENVASPRPQNIEPPTPAAEPPVATPAARKSLWPYMLVLAIIVAAAGSFWWWKQKNGTATNTNAAEEYQLAMQSIADTSGGYIPHLQKAAALNYDSAQWQLALYYLKHDREDDAMPYLRKLTDTLNGNAGRYRDVQPVYAKILLEKHRTSEATAVLQYGAKHGDAECAYQLGMFYYNQKNYTEALQWLKQSADQDNDKALAQLGVMYFMRQGIKEDDDEADAIAIDYCFKAANKGNSVGMYSLGLAYKNGKGVPVNEKQAKTWFQKVIKKADNPEAANSARLQLGLTRANDSIPVK